MPRSAAYGVFSYLFFGLTFALNVDPGIAAAMASWAWWYWLPPASVARSGKSSAVSREMGQWIEEGELLDETPQASCSPWPASASPHISAYFLLVVEASKPETKSIFGERLLRFR
jgi:hypothetical protein